MNWFLAPAGHSPAMSGALNSSGMKRAVRDMARIAKLLLNKISIVLVRVCAAWSSRSDNALPTAGVDNSGDKLSVAGAVHSLLWMLRRWCFFERNQCVIHVLRAAPIAATPWGMPASGRVLYTAMSF